MLIWINGPFGGGKTQTAAELHRRLPGSVLCDPEEAGFGLHRMTPRPLRGDFQDLTAWRLGVVEVLDLVLRRHEGPVIVPMTVIRPDYFAETVGRLRELGHQVHHFALLASRETVVRRLRERGFGHLARLVTGQEGSLRRESFAMSTLDECLASLPAAEFAEHLWTDHTPIAAVAEHIAGVAGYSLTAPDGPVRGPLRRAWVGVRHIRLR